MEDFLKKYPQCEDLGTALNGSEPFDYGAFKTIPGWTLKKCKALHEKMIATREVTQ